jgi:dTDP-4-amino-4,6-dideoxygalactose transaminase
MPPKRKATARSGPAFPQGPPAWPLADDGVRAALEAAYADGSWGRYNGPHGERLAARLAEMHAVEHVLLCASGTIAVEIALRGMKIGEGDEVILAGYDFAGNFRAIEAVGARPVLADIEADTWCLDPAAVEAAVSSATRAVIVSHLHGTLAAMQTIGRIAKKHKLAVLEDACQVPGATVSGKPAGSLGDVGVHSFGGSKLLTAGRGGAVLTRHADAHQRMKVFCERGNQAFPLSELQAAVLPPQLDKLQQRNQQRGRAAARLSTALADVASLRPPAENRERGAPAYYKLAWWYEASRSGKSREAFLAAAQAAGVAIDAGFRGFTRRPPSVCRKAGRLANCQRAVDQTVVLHHPVLLEDDATLDRVADAIRQAAE